MQYPDTLNSIGVVTVSPDEPQQPATGDLWFDLTMLLMWDGEAWVKVGGDGAITSDPVAPSDPVDGQLWYDSASDILNVWEDDANGGAGAWVPVSGGSNPVVNLSWTPQTSGGIVANTGGTDATIPDADDQDAGLMPPGDKQKIDFITVTDDIDLDNLGDGTTNLGYTAAADSGTVTSSTGTDATLPPVDDTNAGLMLPAARLKLNGIEDGADVTDAENVSGSGAPLVSISTGVPQTTPNKKGDLNLDQENGVLYFGIDTTSQADWIELQAGAWDGSLDHLSNVPQNTIVGRISAGDGQSQNLTAAQVRTLLNISDGANNYTHPNHSGDVVSAGDGSTTIQPGAVSLQKFQDISDNRILGRHDEGGSGTVEQLSASDVRNLINVEDGASGDMTAAEIKTAYESNADTNAFTTSEKNKLSGITDGANNYTHPNHTGDVTSAGDGSTTIGAGKVTNAKLANQPVFSFKGNATDTVGAPPEDIQFSDFASGTWGDNINLVGFDDAGSMYVFDWSDISVLDPDAIETISARWIFSDGITAPGAIGMDIGEAGYTRFDVVADAVVLNGDAGTWIKTDPANENASLVIGAVDPITGLARIDFALHVPAQEQEETDDTSGNQTIGTGWSLLPIEITTATDFAKGSTISLVGYAENSARDDVIDFQIEIGGQPVSIGSTPIQQNENIAFAHTVTSAQIISSGTLIEAYARKTEAQSIITIFADVLQPLKLSMFEQQSGGGGGGLSDVVGSGDGNSLVSDVSGGVATLKDLVAGTGITITDNTTHLELQATGGGGDPEQLANVETQRIIGRISANTGVSEELTAAQARTLLNVEDGADVTDADNVASAGASMVLTGAGAPSTIPDKVGNQYIDLTNDQTYIAVDVTAVGDWKRALQAGESVSVDELSNVTENRLIGRQDGAGDGNSQELTPSAARTLLNVADGANAYAHPNHSGDVSSDGDGSTTIGAGKVTFSKIQDIPQNNLIGRTAAGSGAPTDLTVSEVQALLNIADGANDYTHPNHSGDVSSDGDGSTTIGAGKVTYAKIQNLSGPGFMARTADGAGSVSLVDASAARSFLNVADGANDYTHPNHSGDVSSAGDGTTTIGAGKVTFDKFQSVPSGNLIGRTAADTGAVTDLTKGEVQSFLNVADGANNYTHPNHSGDVTSDGDGATTIGAGKVTYAKMQTMAGAGLLGRASAGAVSELNASAARSLLNVENNADVTDAENVASAGAVMQNATHNGTAGLKIASMTQANYDAITPDADTLYFITG